MFKWAVIAVLGLHSLMIGVLFACIKQLQDSVITTLKQKDGDGA